jgi:hypothetical protein
VTPNESDQLIVGWVSPRTEMYSSDGEVVRPLCPRDDPGRGQRVDSTRPLSHPSPSLGSCQSRIVENGAEELHEMLRPHTRFETPGCKIRLRWVGDCGGARASLASAVDMQYGGRATRAPYGASGRWRSDDGEAHESNTVLLTDTNGSPTREAPQELLHRDAHGQENFRSVGASPWW